MPAEKVHVRICPSRVAFVAYRKNIASQAVREWIDRHLQKCRPCRNAFQKGDDGFIRNEIVKPPRMLYHLNKDRGCVQYPSYAALHRSIYDVSECPSQTEIDRLTDRGHPLPEPESVIAYMRDHCVFCNRCRRILSRILKRKMKTERNDDFETAGETA